MSFVALRYLLGNITYAGAQFVIVLLLNKFGSPSLMGQYALGLAVTAPVFMLSHLHLRSVMVVDVAGKYAISEFLGLRLVTTAAAFSVTTGILLFGGFDRSTAGVIFLISLSRILESLSDMLLGICQKHERLEFIAFSRVAKGLFSMLSIALVFIPTQNLSLALLIMVVGWLGITIAYEGRKARRFASLRPSFDKRRLLQLLRASSPLGVVLALMSLNTNIPQYAIATYGGEQTLGVFASLSYLIVACNVVVTALGEAITPRLARWHAAGRHADFLRLLGRMVAIGMGCSALGTLIGWPFGKELLTLLFNPAMADETRLFGWMLASTVLVFASSFMWYGITATGRFTAQIPLFLCTVTCNAAACLLLVPGHGAIGAAISGLIALGVQTIGCLLVLAYVIRQAKQSGVREAAA